MKKTYILDTNVLLSDPNFHRNFQDNDLIVPILVLEELDHHKSRSDEVGRNCREVSRALDALSEKGSLKNGVVLPNGGTLKVLASETGYNDLLPPELIKGSSVDNMIIGFALKLRDKFPNAILVSKDINVRVKCASLGLPAEDYFAIRVSDNLESLYTGVKVITTEEKIVKSFYSGAPLQVADLTDSKTYPNQIVVLKSVDANGDTINSALSRVSLDGKLSQLKKVDDIFGLKPRNKEQSFSVELLMDPSIKLITLTGKAGCVDPKTCIRTKLIVKNRNIPLPADSYEYADYENE
jgi:PhoH-like ATPase